MRAWQVITVATVFAAGCGAPSEPDPAAQADPLEEAIARGRFPDAVTRVLRVLSQMPYRTPAGEALRQLGLSIDDALDGGWDNGRTTSLDWDLADGYRLNLVFTEWGPIDGPFDGPDPPELLLGAAVSVRREGGPEGVTYELVYPLWDSGKLRYK